MAIPPETSLALAVQANKGIYALLLGSGVSRAAGIPTGWEVVLDLIRRVAKANKDDAGIDPVAWYKSKFGLEPSYSDVIEQLARTRAEREVLLRPYFEPNEQERENGLKQPTAAHRSIAKLVAQGFIRVIISTNFDRLMERALQDEGVQPNVISSADQAEGALPPQHTRCLLIKLHGDYLDTRLRNTRDELAAYEPQLQALLDRILEEYGVAISGWSGEWDTALGDTFERTTRHRFTTFWLARDGLGDRAKRIIEHRRALIVPIQSADKAFEGLADRVAAIDAGLVADPVSPSVGVALVKRLLANQAQNRITIEDFFIEEAKTVLRKTNVEVMPLGSVEPNESTFRDRVARMETALSILVPCSFTAVRFGNTELDAIWKRSLILLGRHETKSGTIYEEWSCLKRYPATLLLYSTGLASVAFHRPTLFGSLVLKTMIPLDARSSAVAGDYLQARAALYHNAAQWLFPGHNRKTPGSDHLQTTLAHMLATLFDHESDFARVFDHFEIYLSLALASIDQHPATGGFAWRSFYGRGELQQVIKEIESKGTQHFIYQAGIFSDSAEYERAKEMVVAAASRVGS